MPLITTVALAASVDQDQSIVLKHGQNAGTKLQLSAAESKIRMFNWCIWYFKVFIKDHQFSNLTHYQTTNFRLFQTERVCRRQFQI